MSRLSYLVTGAAGFIGSHLVEALLADTDEVARVVGVDDLSSGSRANLAAIESHRHFTFLEGDLRDLMRGTSPIAMPLRAARFDGIFHLAGRVGVTVALREGVGVLEANHAMTRALVELATECWPRARFLFTSSSEVYGDQESQPLAESAPLALPPPTDPRWGYAYEKAYAEAWLLGRAKKRGGMREGGGDFVATRLFNTVGPRQNTGYGAVLPAFVTAACAGAPLVVHANAKGHVPTRSFCHVRDIVAGLITVMREGARGEVYNVGGSEETSVEALAHAVRESAIARGGAVAVAATRSQVARETRSQAVVGCRRRVADTRKLQALGWRAQRDLGAIIADAIEARVGAGSAET